MTLFCPQGHLLLHRQNDEVISLQTCPRCGWQAPAERATGEALWQTDLEAPLGGPGRRVYARPAAHRGRVFLPLANGELVALELTTGQMAWRRTVGDAHLVARELAVVAGQLLALQMDHRTLGTEHALVSVEPDTGALTPVFAGHGPLVGLVPFREGVLTRSPEGVIYLTPEGETWHVRWQTPLPTWVVPPVPAPEAERVAALTFDLKRGEGTCVLLNGVNGVRAAELPLPAEMARAGAALRGAAAGSLVVWSGERARGVWAVDALTGQTRWLHPLRAYTPPTASGDKIWVVARGQAPAGVLGHYLLLGLDSASGDTVVEMPLPRRVLIPPLALGNTVFLFDESGVVLALAPEQGEILWEAPLGSKEDPPGSRLLMASRTLIAGTFFGRVTALQVWAAADGEQVAPEDLLAAGEFEAAAAAYALQGDLRRAAQIYAEHLKDPHKALALLEFGDHLTEALAVAQEQGWYDEVERLAARLGELDVQAEARERRGDLLGAARLWEEYGRRHRDNEALEKAADIYQRIGSEDEAWRLKKELGQVGFLKQLLGLLPSWEDLESYAEEEGLFEAAYLASERGLHDRAAEFFRRAAEEAHARGDHDQARRAWEEERRVLEIYLERAQSSVGDSPWAWERIAQISRKLGDFVREAQAWEALGEDEYEQAADAYYRAAIQLDQQEARRGVTRSRANDRRIAHFYEKFLQLNGVEEARLVGWKEESDQRIAEARERLLALRRMPRLVVETVQTNKSFQEEDFSTLKVRIINRGYGIAKQVELLVGEGGRFEVVPEEKQQHEVRLGAGKSEEIGFFVRPLTGQAGEAVPLRIRWRWTDKAGRRYEQERSFPVVVHRRDEGNTQGSQPMIIHAENVLTGTDVKFYQGGTHVEGGTYIQGGDYVQGQKGDKVEINKGAQKGRVVVKENEVEVAHQDAKPAPQKRICPVCHVSIPAEVAVCPYCGNPVSAPEQNGPAA